MRLLLVLASTALMLSACRSRDEKLKDAEEEGNLLTATKAKLIKGAGEALKKEGKEAMEVVAEGTGEVVKGLGQGLDKSLKTVKVKTDASVSANGIVITRAAKGEDGTKKNTITAYVTFEQPFAGVLEMRAFDNDDAEVGRVKVETNEKEAGAHYVDFTFDERTPLLAAPYVQVRATLKAP